MDYDEAYDIKISKLIARILETSVEQKSTYASFCDEGKEIILQKIETYESNFITVFNNIQYDIDCQRIKGMGKDEEDYVHFKHLGTNFKPYQGIISTIKCSMPLRVLICGNKKGYNKALFNYFRKNAPNIILLGYSFNGYEIEDIAETFHPHIVFITVTLHDEMNCAAIKKIVKTFPAIRVVAILGSDTMRAQVESVGANDIFSRYDPFSMLLALACNTDYENIDFTIPEEQSNSNTIKCATIENRFKLHFPQLTKLKSLFLKYFI